MHQYSISVIHGRPAPAQLAEQREWQSPSQTGDEGEAPDVGEGA
jgi:hypothetical protein